MRFRKLRISFSAVYGIICLLVIALWVRSYFIFDTDYLRLPWRVFSIQSIRGESVLWTTRVPGDFEVLLSTIRFSDHLQAQRGHALGFGGRIHPGGFVAKFPCWFPVLLATLAAAAPWFNWRFSVRALLTATSLFALLFGLVVYASR
jgi:hypothetical protein